MKISDERMIQLMEYAVRNGIALNEGDYWQKIKFSRTGLSNIRRGIQSFRTTHIANACVVTGASADWLLGVDNVMFRNDIKKPVVRHLQEVIAEIQGPRNMYNRKILAGAYKVAN
jgi:hypothetical protein